MMANGELPSGTVVVGVHMPLRNLHLCQVTTLDQDLRPVGNGMVFKKGWRYTKVLNYHFKKVPKSQTGRHGRQWPNETAIWPFLRKRTFGAQKRPNIRIRMNIHFTEYMAY